MTSLEGRQLVVPRGHHGGARLRPGCVLHPWYDVRYLILGARPLGLAQAGCVGEQGGAQRLSAVEENVDRHSRVIKRAIEIAANYFQSRSQ